MLTEIDTVKLIFGLKVQQLRKEHDLSYQQLSDRTGLAISYLHNIEKGRKYPKADKILVLAKVLEVDYDYLVSLNGNKKLKPIVDLLNSDFLKIFPLEMFGINTAKLMELLAQTPDKVNAFLSTVIHIIRNYHLSGEDFYQAALRSYQDLYDNYFKEEEELARAFRRANDIGTNFAMTTKSLENFLLQNFGIHTDRKLLSTREALKMVRSYYSPTQKILYINTGLMQAQENFLLAKELGFQTMQLEERPFETRMIEVDTFDKLLNNFKASYFAGALLMDEEKIIADIHQMSTWTTWKPSAFLELLDKYVVTPEMMLQRFANILPKHFRVKDAFFLRFFAKKDLRNFYITKEMHLSQLHDPHANQLDEHYCRRWVSIDLIKRLRTEQDLPNKQPLIADAQISRYWQSSNAYLCFCIAKPDTNNPENSVSVTLGLLMNSKLQRLFPFLKDPNLKTRDVYTTCERCGIMDCEDRDFPPIHLEREQERAKIKEGIEKLKEEIG
jgi:transcriptional regulator with XRE-family HTH domain